MGHGGVRIPWAPPPWIHPCRAASRCTYSCNYNNSNAQHLNDAGQPGHNNYVHTEGYSPVWQFLPVKFAAHWHRYQPLPWRHTPWFWQGFEKHSSRSEKVRKRYKNINDLSSGWLSGFTVSSLPNTSLTYAAAYRIPFLLKLADYCWVNDDQRSKKSAVSAENYG